MRTLLTPKAPNTIAEFANTVDPDETAHNEPSHQDLQFLPSSLRFFNKKHFILKVFRNFADVILSSAFIGGSKQVNSGTEILSLTHVCLNFLHYAALVI